MTEAGSIVGTAQYLSPEQARGAPVDPRSDLYSLGIVLYEMLTGAVPFTGDTPVEIAMKHLSQIPEPPSKLRPEVPHDLDAVVMRALAKDPEQRYDSAEEMDADLAPRRARRVGVARDRGRDDPGALGQRHRDRRDDGAAPADDRGAAARAAGLPRAGLLRLRRAAGRPVDLALAARPRADRRRRGGGWFLYMKIQDQLNNNKPVAVPDVMLMARPLAVQKLQEAGLNPRVVTSPSDTVAKGQVSGENPSSGSKVGKGSTITLTVSTGKPKVQVPNVVGLDATSAVATLAQLGLDPKIVRIFSDARSRTP